MRRRRGKGCRGGAGIEGMGARTFSLAGPGLRCFFNCSGRLVELSEALVDIYTELWLYMRREDSVAGERGGFMMLLYTIATLTPFVSNPPFLTSQSTPLVLANAIGNSSQFDEIMDCLPIG